MKPLDKIFFIGLLLLAWPITSQSQPIEFRKGIFLHHSTGACIWGSNGSQTSVPDEIQKFNLAHHYSGRHAISLREQAWPSLDNEWATWHRIFENKDTIQADIRPLLRNNRIIIIKSCFPSSNISSIGNPSDTLEPTKKTIMNYKWHWRSMVKIMKQHPENFFVIWTNAPLVAQQTNNSEAWLSEKFCLWAKNIFAKGLDSEFGPFPQNVYVFDFFHTLADRDGKLPLAYASDVANSHPNGAATKIAAPLFVQEVFDAAIKYETIFSE
jgi:hypothetical protein